MAHIGQIEVAFLRSRRALLVVIVAVLAVLAAAVAVTTLQVRRNIRAQLAQRDAEVLYAVALMHYADDVADGLAGPISDPGNQLSIVLRSSQLRGVLGVRLFDPQGRYVESFPPYVTEGTLAKEHFARLQHLQPVSRFHPEVAMNEMFYAEKGRPAGGAVPVLEINVPLHLPEQPLAGIAQFLIEGQSLAAEYARLDRDLALQAGVAVAASGAVLSLALAWAFKRLRSAHRLVAERTANLLQANQQLALAAKTSALGAVTAHLIHGLKNPLAGLQQYVAARATAAQDEPESDSQQALASTRRMQAMINQVVGVLRDEQTSVGYELSVRELAEVVSSRIEPMAKARGVQFTVTVSAEAGLSSRVANLAALILLNLVENALQVTPSGKAVWLTITSGGTGLVFDIRDHGTGFPAGQPLFRPCTSTKEGGTGIGLAVCKQLANHLGAELELVVNQPDGCVFRLTLPVPVEQRRTPAAEPAAAR